MQRSIIARIARASGIIVAIVLAASLALPNGAALAQSGGSKLSKHDRELIALARVRGESKVTLLFAAKTGATGSLSSGLTGLGGTIGFSETDIGYVRASVPIDKAEQAAALSSVQARGQRDHTDRGS
jgi:hypothetical protein